MVELTYTAVPFGAAVHFNNFDPEPFDKFLPNCRICSIPIQYFYFVHPILWLFGLIIEISGSDSYVNFAYSNIFTHLISSSIYLIISPKY